MSLEALAQGLWSFSAPYNPMLRLSVLLLTWIRILGQLDCGKDFIIGLLCRHRITPNFGSPPPLLPLPKFHACSFQGFQGPKQKQNKRYERKTLASIQTYLLKLFRSASVNFHFAISERITIQLSTGKNQ